MTKPADRATERPRIATAQNHSLSLIAMVVMAGMCLAALIYAGSINLD